MKKQLKIPDTHLVQIVEVETMEKEIQELRVKLHDALTNKKEYKDQIMLLEV